ncbi:MAG: transglutaminase domain-containing protein [Clostridia bacterium]|nr:transglutaminase domain-containing protein [Clostridia bacterium]
MFAGKHGKLVLGIFAMLVLVVCTFVFSLSEVLMPVASGKKVLKADKLTVDASNADQGYIMVKGPKTKTRLKVTVEITGSKLQYDLNGDGEYEVFPLQLGRTNYTVSLWRQVEGKKYGKIGQVKVAPKMEDELSCFLYPNQYVNYKKDSPCVKEANEVCKGLETNKEKFYAIWDYIVRNFQYDYVKAVTVAGSSGMLPDIEGCWKGKKGICQDLSAVACAMMRSQGIPARLMIGQLGSGTPHAWVMAWVDGEDIFFDPTAEKNASNKSDSYTILRWY